MSWTLADIRTEVRNLTGRKNTANPSNSDIDIRINRFITFKLVQIAKFNRQESFYNFTTTAALGTYSLPTTFQFLEARGFIGDDEINIFRNPDLFWSRWNVDTSNDSAKPSEILIWGNELTLRALPDDAYNVRIIGYERPSELTSDSSTMRNEGWGELVAYGTSIDMLNSDGNFERSALLNRGYKTALNNAMNDTVSELSDQRAIPKW